MIDAFSQVDVIALVSTCPSTRRSPARPQPRGRPGAGKATLSRRWASKTELVAHAVSQVGDERTLDDLPDTASAALVAPYVSSHRLLIQRAVERGEVSPEIDAETIAFVTPSMTAFRLIVQRKPIDVDFLRTLVDTVVLPALGLEP